MNRARKVGSALALAALIVVAIGVHAQVRVRRLSESNRRVIHTYQAMESLERALAMLRDAETGQRGFLLTGDERYLEPHAAAAVRIGPELDALPLPIEDKLGHRANLGRIRRLAGAKLAELAETIRLRRESGPEAALQVVRSDRGKAIVDELRAVAGEIEAGMQRSLEASNLKAIDDERRLLLTNAVVIPFALGTIAIAVVTLLRGYRPVGPERRASTPGRRWPGVALRYGSAALLVAMALVFRRLTESVGPLPTFITFYPAVLLVAIIGGTGPGIFATVLSVAVTDYFLLEPIGSWAIEAPSDLLAMGVFASTCFCISLVAENLHRARRAEAVQLAQEQELALLDLGNSLSLDPDRRIVRWSEGCRRLYGFGAGEVRGHLADELLQTRFKQRPEQVDRALIERGGWEGELTRRRKDGSELVVEVVRALRRDALGRPLAILEVSTDITGRHRDEAAIRRQAALIDLSPDAIMVRRLDGTITFWSRGAEALYGWSKDQAIGRSTHPLLRTRFPEPIEQIDDQLKRDGRWSGELIHHASDGREVVVQSWWLAQLDERGEVIELLESNVDITARKRVETALRESEERLQAFMDNSPAISWAKDERGRYVYLSGAYSRRFGVDLDTYRDKTDFELWPPEVAEQFWRNDRAVLESGRTVEVIEETGARGGMPCHFLSLKFPFRDASGRLYVGGMAVDITGRLRVEEQLRTTLESIGDGFVAFDADWRFVYVNAPAERLLGAGREELLGRDHWEMFPTTRDTPLERDYRRAAAGEDLECENYLEPWGRWFHLRCSPRRGGGISVYFQDVTERKRSERVLREIERRLKMAVQAARIGSFELDIRTGTNLWSPELEAMYGLGPGEFGGTQPAWEQLVHPDDHEAAIERVRRAFESDDPVEGEWRVPWPDGSVHWIFGRFQALKDDDGTPLSLVGVNIDITDRRRAEEALRRSEDRFRTMADAIPQLAWIAEADGYIFWYNRRWYEYTGTTPEQMAGWGWQSVHDPQRLPAVLERWKGSIATGEPFDMVLPLRGSDNVLRPFLTRVMPLKDDGGRVRQWFGTNTDVSEQQGVEEALRESEERLRFALETCHIGAWELDVVDHTTIRSPEHDRILGHPELLAHWTLEMFLDQTVPEDRAAVADAVRRAAAARTGWDFVCRVRRADNADVRWVWCVGRPRTERDGRVRRVAGIIQDITERKAAEEAVRESEERYRLLIEGVRDYAIFTLDPEGCVTSWNAGAERIKGYRAEEILGRSFSRFYPPEAAWCDVPARTLQTAAADGQCEDLGWRVRKDGTRFWADTLITALRDESGHLRGFVKIARDVTDRKQAEARILRQSAVLDGINRIFRDALRCETDEELGRTCLAVAQDITSSRFGFVGEINETTGLLDDIAISDPGWEVCGIDPHSRIRRPPMHFEIDGIYGRVLLDGRGLIVNDPSAQPDGIGLPPGHPPLTAFLGVPLVRDGQTFGMVAVGSREGGYGQEQMEDLEALAPAMMESLSRIRAEAALRRLNEELDERVQARTTDLEASNKELEAFSYSVSHDLRSPLRGMDGFSQALLDSYSGQLDDRGRDWLNRIRAGCQRMGQLIDDLLRLSRVTRAELRRRRIDLTAMAGEIAAELREHAPDRPAEFRIAEGLTIVGDPALLRPALRNLLENAWKFSGKRAAAVIELGRTTIPPPSDPAAGAEPGRSGPGDSAYFVRDNGAGFDMAYADKLFGPFQRLHSVRDYPGTGIGLALAQRVVHRHGGRIWAEAAPDRGATFYFTLGAPGVGDGA